MQVKRKRVFAQGLPTAIAEQIEEYSNYRAKILEEVILS
jgi:hypothetical protein